MSYSPDFFEPKDHLGAEKRERIRALEAQAREGSIGAVIVLWEVFGIRLPLVEQQHWPNGIDREIRRLRR